MKYNFIVLLFLLFGSWNYNNQQQLFVNALQPFIFTLYTTESSLAISLDPQFDMPTSATVNGANCFISSVEQDLVVCTPPRGVFQSESLNVVVVNAFGPSTVFNYRFPNIIQSSSSSLQGATFNGNFPAIDNRWVMMGIAPNTIVFDSMTGTSLALTYPSFIRCGLAYIFFVNNRQSNDFMFCPTPVIESSSFLNNGLSLTVKYLDSGGVDTLDLFIQYSGGSKEVCTSSQLNPPSYRVSCYVNPAFRDYSFNALFLVTNKRAQVGYSNNPIINGFDATYFQVPGTVTIHGSNLNAAGGLYSVTIGGEPCSPTITGSSSISCSFASVVPDTNPLQIKVELDGFFVATSDTFKYKVGVCPTANGKTCAGHGSCKADYTCDCTSPWTTADCSVIYPQLSSISGTHYGVPGKVTINGDNFDPSGLHITIGGSICSSPIVMSATLIECTYQSDVPQNANNDPLLVYLSIEGKNAIQQSIFFYLDSSSSSSSISSSSSSDADNCPIGLNGKICSGHGSCGVNQICICDKGWGAFKDCSTINPIIKSASSTKYGEPAKVTIKGENFAPNQLQVKIGGLLCTDPESSNDLKTIVCFFQSNITVNSYNDALEVYVSIEDTFIHKNNVFLYYKPSSTCAIGQNGQVCSGNGDCDQQLLYCICYKGWLSTDCSIKDTGIIIDDPTVNQNTSTTITTPNGNRFDVGLVMVNELNSNNDIVLSYTQDTINWQPIANRETQFTAKLANNATLISKLTINYLEEQIYYNFAGDTIPILPKSIKYQIELHNWTFSSSLNTVEFIFKSGLTENNNKCKDQSSSTISVDNNGGDQDSLRTIQILLNGEVLVGTFSDRIVLDNRPSYNKVNKLTDDQLKKYKLDSSTTTDIIYTSILSSHFMNSVIVDPNFGVLVKSTQDECRDGMPNWKLAVIIVCSVVGAAILVTATWMLYKKNHRVRAVAYKLKHINK